MSPQEITPEIEEEGKPNFTEFVPIHRKTMERMQMAWSNALFVPTQEGKVTIQMTQEEFDFLDSKLNFISN